MVENIRAHRLRRYMYLCLSLGTAAMAGSAGQAGALTVVSGETLASGPFVAELEFNSIDDRVTWMDNSKNVWAAEIDPASGDLIPPWGRGAMIDDQGAHISEIKNGSEWVLDNGVPRVVYTREIEGIYSLAAATQQDDVSWTIEPLPFSDGKLLPRGSVDPGDPQPRILYKDLDENVYWRLLSHPGSESSLGQAKGSRWVPGHRQIVYIQYPGPRSALAQIFLLDIDTGEDTKITQTGGAKHFPWVWTDPESNARALTFIRGTTYGPTPNSYSVDVHIEYDPGSLWPQMHSLGVPETAIGPVVKNVRPLTHDGASHLVVMLSTSPLASAHSELWVVESVLSDTPQWHRISSDMVAKRAGIELTEVNGNPAVYYRAKDATDGSPSGIYRIVLDF